MIKSIGLLTIISLSLISMVLAQSSGTLAVIATDPANPGTNTDANTFATTVANTAPLPTRTLAARTVTSAANPLATTDPFLGPTSVATVTRAGTVSSPSPVRANNGNTNSQQTPTSANSVNAAQKLGLGGMAIAIVVVAFSIMNG